MKRLKDLGDIRRTFVVDALRYSFSIEDSDYHELWEILRSMEPLFQADDDIETQVIRALSKAWSLIDLTHKVRRLIQQVRGLPQNTSDVQLFLRATERIDVFRNYFQHLSTEISKISGQSNPIMGSISWVGNTPNESYTFIATSPCQDVSTPGLAVDTRTMEFTCDLQLSAQNQDLCLRTVHSKVQDLRAFFSDWLEQQEMLINEEHRTGKMRFIIQAEASPRVAH